MYVLIQDFEFKMTKEINLYLNLDRAKQTW